MENRPAVAAALDEVPYNVQKALVELRNIDEIYQDAVSNLNEKKRAFLGLYGGRPGLRDPAVDFRAMRAEVDRLHKSALSQCDQKIGLVDSTHKNLCKHLRAIDAELARYDIAPYKSVAFPLVSQAAAEESLKAPRDRKDPAFQEKREPRRRQTSFQRCSPSPTPETELPADDESAGDADGQLYCICNQVSFGDMVACDNKDCPTEWFHFGCVGLREQPTGKWYCSQCAALMKSRKKRKRSVAPVAPQSASASPAPTGNRIKSEP